MRTAQKLSPTNCCSVNTISFTIKTRPLHAFPTSSFGIDTTGKALLAGRTCRTRQLEVEIFTGSRMLPEWGAWLPCVSNARDSHIVSILKEVTVSMYANITRVNSARLKTALNTTS